MLLTIEKLVYGGDGLARLTADTPHEGAPDQGGRGQAVFVPLVLAGEKVQATIVERKPGFARARADAIVAPSPHRVQPACPYFSRCGGCHYQHAGYEHQLDIKKNTLRETLRRTAKIDLSCDIEVHPSPPWSYRNRSRLQAQTKPDFAVGYFGLASHQLQAVEVCPISSPLINLGIAALWRIGRRRGKLAEGVREIEFFANADDTQLLVEIRCKPGARRADVRAVAEELRAELPQIAGIVAFPDSAGQDGDRMVVSGSDHLAYRTQRSEYRVSAGAFFQTNRHLTDELVRLVTESQSGELALDLYAGVGLFSTALACDFRHVVSVESSQTSTADLAYNRRANTEVVQATTAQYLARVEKSGLKSTALPLGDSRPDLVVADPPRSGLGRPVAQLLAKLGASRVIYVSCDPATLARDLADLLPAGYRIEQVHVVDLFPQTYHIESVVHLKR